MLSRMIRARLLVTGLTTLRRRTTLLGAEAIRHPPVQVGETRRLDLPDDQGRAPLSVSARAHHLPVSLVGDVVVGRDGDDVKLVRDYGELDLPHVELGPL